MFRIQKAIFLFLLFSFSAQIIHAQETVIPRLIWKVNKVDFGSVLEEEGAKIAEFEFTHTQDSLFYIDQVITDCGCTTVDYSKDTLSVGGTGKLLVSFDPSSTAGFFSRMIVVKGNLIGSQDTLYIEGTSIPFPENPVLAYPRKEGTLGFRLPKVNLGEVLTNGPKVKQVEIYNFGTEPIQRKDLIYAGPEYIKIFQQEEMIYPNQRGLLDVVYDAVIKEELGFSEDQVLLTWAGEKAARLDVIANVFEYFPPLSKDQFNQVPQLSISPSEIDLKEISANSIQNKSVTLTNKGREVLEIRKIQGNCDCLVLEISKTTINPGESIDLKITFDPKGRKGIDQRNIYIFSTDPLNSVQLLILKSRVE
jgi:hypothetical protein